MGLEVVQSILILTLVQSVNELSDAQLMVESLRQFGGELQNARVLVFAPAGSEEWLYDLELPEVERVLLPAEPMVPEYYFRNKVQACAEAERLADASIRTLIWMSPQMLIVQPPVEMVLSDRIDVAVRPVQVRNVGITVEDELDGYWQGICDHLQMSPPAGSVTTFVDGETIHPYYNSHAFAVNPQRKLMQRWWKEFRELVKDAEFQREFCVDSLRRIFMHQALLSVLLSDPGVEEALRILPENYNYPYNLQDRVPFSRRATSLNDLVTVAWEERSLNPYAMGDITVDDPLKSWLAARITEQE